MIPNQRLASDGAATPKRAAIKRLYGVYDWDQGHANLICTTYAATAALAISAVGGGSFARRIAGTK